MRYFNFFAEVPLRSWLHRTTVGALFLELDAHGSADTPSRGYGGVFLGSLLEKAPGSLSKSCRDSAGRSIHPIHVLRFRTGATGPKVKVRCKMRESYCHPALSEYLDESQIDVNRRRASSGKLLNISSCQRVSCVFHLFFACVPQPGTGGLFSITVHRKLLWRCTGFCLPSGFSIR